MALYSGIHKKLKDRDTKWSDKLQLAKFAWISSQCYLPNKEQVLLDWVSNSIINSKKLEIPDEVLPHLWSYLSSILNSSRIDSRIHDDKTVTIKPDLIKVYIDYLRREDADICLEHVISCCQATLSSHNLMLIFTAKYEVFVQFFSSLLSLSSNILSNDGTLSVAMEILLTSSLERYSTLQRQQINQRMVFVSVYEHLFIAGMSLHHQLCKKQHNMDTEKTRQIIENIIISGIFHRDHSDVFTKYLADKSEDKLEMIEKFIIFLQTSMKSTPDIVHYSLPILYRGFLTTQKPSTTTEFSMFCKLCSVIGVISQSPDCPETPDVPWQPVLDSLQILLETRLTLDLYNTTSDNSTGLVQYTWYQNLLSLLLSFPQSHLLSWFGCIHVLLKKNHLILDKNLVMVCRKVWIEVDCDDKDLNTTQYALLCDLMETYTKLRQFNKLMKALLQAIRASMVTPGNSLLSHKLQDKFAACIQSLPPGLTLNIWQQLTIELSQHYLPQIEKLVDSGESPRKKQKTKKNYTPSMQQESRIMHQFELTVALYVHYLFNAKLVDAATTAVHNIEVAMETMQNNLLMPLLELCLHSDQVIPRLFLCTLYLYHCWGDVHLLLKQHTKYRDKKEVCPSSIQQPLKALDFSYLYSHITADKWISLCTQSGVDVNTAHKYMMKLLSVQKVKALLVFGSDSCPAIQESLQNSLAYICQLEDNIQTVTEVSLFPLMPSSVCEMSLISNHVLVFLPLCNADQLQLLSHYVVKMICTSHKHTPQISDVLIQDSSTLLQSEVFQESVLIQAAMVTSLLQELLKMFNSYDAEYEMQVLSKLVAKEIPWLQQVDSRPSLKIRNEAMEDDCDNTTADTMALNESWKQIQNIGIKMNVYMSGKMENDIQLNNKHYKKIGRILEVLEMLPLEHFLLTNQTRCMMGLFVLCQAICRSASHKPEQTVVMVMKCSNILRRLIQGVNRANILDFVESGSVLTMLTKVAVTIHDMTTERLNKIDSVPLNDLICIILRSSYRVTSRMVSLDAFIKVISLSSMKKQIKKTSDVESLVSMVTPNLAVICVLLEDILGLSGKVPNQSMPTLLEHQQIISTQLQGVIATISKKGLLSMLSTEPITIRVMTLILKLKLKISVAMESEEWEAMFDPVFRHAIQYFAKCDLVSNYLLSHDYIRFLCTVLQGFDLLSNVLPKNFILIAWNTLKTVIQHSKGDNVIEFSQALLKHTTSEDLIAVFQLSHDMNISSLLPVLHMFKLLLDSSDQLEVTKEIVPVITVNIVTSLQQNNEDQTTLLMLQVLNQIVQKRLLEPRMVLFVLHGCLSVLDINTASVQTVCLSEATIYTALSTILYSMLNNYSKVIITALPSYISCVSHLMHSVMSGSQQNDCAIEELNRCAQDLERLLASLSRNKIDVCRMAPFIVTEYINQLQKYTVDPLIKATLTPGIHCLLQLCDRNGLALLYTTLPDDLKEVFKSFHSEFNKYYKYKGKV